MTNLLTVVAKVFSNTLIFLLQNIQCKSYSHFFSKNINVFAIFQDGNFNVTLANNFLKFWTTGSCFTNCSALSDLGLFLSAQACLSEY